jgi:sugar phosphate isomerase/epimerase
MAVVSPSDSPRPGSSPGAHLVSIGSWAFAFGPYERDPWPFERVCEFAASAGYDGVEINGFRPHPHFDDFPGGTGTSDLAAQIRDRGLGVSAYAPNFRHVPPPKVATETYLAEIDKARAFCERLDIRTLRVDTAIPPQEMSAEDYERCLHRLVTSWSLAAERCHRSRVTLVWEFEPGFWLNRPSEIERVLTSVGHPNFGLLLDSSHAYTGGVRGARQGPTPESVDSVEAFAIRFLSFIKHLHLADSDGSLHDEDTSAHTPLGKGEVDFPSLLRVLAPIADRLPWWCVDLCYCEEADMKATEALSYVRGLEREVGLSARTVPK